MVVNGKLYNILKMSYASLYHNFMANGHSQLFGYHLFFRFQFRCINFYHERIHFSFVFHFFVDFFSTDLLTLSIITFFKPIIGSLAGVLVCCIFDI